MEEERQSGLQFIYANDSERLYPPLIYVTHAMPHLPCPESLLRFQEGKHLALSDNCLITTYEEDP